MGEARAGATEVAAVRVAAAVTVVARGAEDLAVAMAAAVKVVVMVVAERAAATAAVG